MIHWDKMAHAATSFYLGQLVTSTSLYGSAAVIQNRWSVLLLFSLYFSMLLHYGPFESLPCPLP